MLSLMVQAIFGNGNPMLFPFFTWTRQRRGGDFHRAVAYTKAFD
jgi:hypothetical protein